MKKVIKDGVSIYHLDKVISDDAMDKLATTSVKPSQIKLFLDKDSDVYTSDNKLLLIFRKNKLSKSSIDPFYDSVIEFAMTETSNRGTASGSKDKRAGFNPAIKSNIFGFFDRFAPKQKSLVRNAGLKMIEVRETRFNMDFPDEYKKTLPLIKEIDELYKEYIPDKYRLQRKKANQTHFKIKDTSFTTVTTNVNFKTTIHKDKGDDIEGFGNLVVIERGKYEGAETCFPQYGVGVNVRETDVLFMDVHQWHGNLPMKKIDKDAIRFSLVCYLRFGVWDRTHGKSKQFYLNHTNTFRKLRTKHNNKTKKKNHNKNNHK